MHITIPLAKFKLLIECIENSLIIDKQRPEIQEQWIKVINNVVASANNDYQQFLKENGGNVSQPSRGELGSGTSMDTNNSTFI